MAQGDSPPKLRAFFVVGPLRTGSSLMARCIDDHEHAICLCESEINRALFPGHLVQLHAQRMNAHGFSSDQVIDLLDRRAPLDVRAMFTWYSACAPVAQRILGKPEIKAFGDKSPDFYQIPEAVALLASKVRLIYTVRDPRAIVRSIWNQPDTTEAAKESRWADLIGNVRAWRPHWHRPNLLVSRYEDLVRAPQAAMARVYAHIGLKNSHRFLQDFPRSHPRRFLWSTAVDLESGAMRSFDPARAEVGDDDIPLALRRRLDADPDIAAYRQQFGY